VSVDLMKQGYAVFRSLSPSCECDLIRMRDGKMERVEVTAGTLMKEGRLTWAKHDRSRYDVLAVYLKDGNVYYFHTEAEEAEMARKGR